MELKDVCISASHYYCSLISIVMQISSEKEAGICQEKWRVEVDHANKKLYKKIDKKRLMGIGVHG